MTQIAVEKSERTCLRAPTKAQGSTFFALMAGVWGAFVALLAASPTTLDDDHPAKAAVDRALAEAGWRPPEWYLAVKAAVAAWGTVELAGVDDFVARHPMGFDRLPGPASGG